MSRSVSPYAPVFPSWDWASRRPFIRVRRLCLWNTRIRTRHVPGPAVPSPQQHANSDAAIRDVTCLFAAGRYKPAKNKDAHRREHDFHLGAQVPALMVRHHIRMNGHRFVVLTTAL